MAGASMKRRRYERRKLYARRGAVVRESVIPRNRAKLQYAKFYRKAYVDNWVFSTASSNGFWRSYQPQLAVLQNVSEYSSLFDLYRVNKVRVTLLPNIGPVGMDHVQPSGTTSVQNQFYIATGVQRGPIVSATGTYGAGSFNDFTQSYDRVKISKFDKPVSVTYVPQQVNTLANGSSLTPPQWCQTSSADVFNIGMGAYLFDSNFVGLNNGQLSVNVIVDLWFECKGSK